jgi:O-antigen/teichoic acid export membrane protein
MSVRRAALWSMSAKYVMFAAHFATSVLIARFFLTPAEVGLFSIALAAAMLVSILQDFGISRYVAGTPDLTDAQIRTCSSVSLIFALGVGVAILALAWPASRFYGDPRLLPLLVVVASSYLFVPFAIVPVALLQRELDFRSIFIVDTGAALAQSAIALTLAALGFSSISLAWAAVAQQATRALLAQWRSGWRPPFPPSLAGARPVLRFGSGASVLYVTGAVGQNSPELIIGRLLNFTAVGLFSRASGLAAHLQQLVSGAIGNVFYPAFARLRDSGEDLAPPYLRVVAAYTGTTWPAMLFLAAAAPPLVLALYGERWAGVAPLLLWVGLCQLFFTALPLHMDLPILLGRMQRLIRLNMLDTLASVGLLTIACFWGLEWAAMSRVGYGVAWFAIYARLMRQLAGFRWRDMAGLYLKSLIAALATIAPLLLVYQERAPASVDFLLLAGCAAAGCLCWLATVFLIRHPIREEVLGVLATIRAALPLPAR